MITIKNKAAIAKMEHAGALLVEIFEEIRPLVVVGTDTLAIDHAIEALIQKKGLVSKMKGYMGYKHVSCISINDVVVHGVPSRNEKINEGDLVKVDVCVAWRGYCADMARAFYVGTMPHSIAHFVDVARCALDKGVACAVPGAKLSDISYAIQCEIEKNGFGVVRDFAGHGIGKRMHEDPEILNYGAPGEGPTLRPGMVFAIEPMITVGAYNVYVCDDGWTVKTQDKSLAMHIEDTVAVTDDGPKILTRTVKP